jgi:hypothetical protein
MDRNWIQLVFYSGLIPDGLTVAYQDKAWMNTSIMVDWLQLHDLNGKHLVLDSFSGHKSKPVQDQLDLIEHSFIPPRCTSTLQPLDVGVNKPFKDRFQL